MPFCSECGEKLNEGAKFCPECGTKTPTGLAATAPTAAASPAAAVAVTTPAPARAGPTPGLFSAPKQAEKKAAPAAVSALASKVAEQCGPEAENGQWIAIGVDGKGNFLVAGTGDSVRTITSLRTLLFINVFYLFIFSYSTLFV